MNRTISIIILTAVMAVLPAVTVSAQSENAKVKKTPESVWSIYLQGGISGYHGFNGMLDCGGKRGVEPEIMFGTKARFRPWIRVGANIGYTKLTATNCGVTTRTYQIPDFPIGSQTATLDVTESALLDKNYQHLFGGDINLDFNILQIWKNRRVKTVNLWAGFGVGGVNAWNKNTNTVAVDVEGVVGGSLYTHSYVNTASAKSTIFSLYIPMNLSLEYDVAPRWTIGLAGHYNWLPLNKDLSPTGIWGADALIRFNFMGKGYKSASCRLNEALAELRDMQDRAAAGAAEAAAALAALQKEKDALKSDVNRLKGENATLGSEIDELTAKLANCGTSEICPDHTVRFILNKSEFTDLEKEILGIFVDRYADTDKKFVLVGEASHSGNSHEYNQKLSEERTGRVKAFMISKGISEDRITARSIGDSANGDESHRRVAITIK